MNNTNFLFWLILIPLIASPIVYIVGRLETRSNKLPRIARWLAIIALAAAYIPLFLASKSVLSGEAIIYQMNAISMELDGIALLFSAVVITLCLLVIIFSTSYMSGEDNEEKFYALLLAMSGAMIGLVCAKDLFNLWVWFEAMAVTSYMLVSFYRKQPAALEAGVKYLVQSASGSVLVVIGIALVFMTAGTLDMSQIAGKGSPEMMALAGAFFIVGFGVKSALVPLHTWLPDAHSQAPSGISAMLSGVVIEAGLIALLRSLSITWLANIPWGVIIMWFAAINMLVGNLMALRQKEVKRMLAYSSVSHMGYILMGIGFALAYQQLNGAAGSFFHLITHAFGKGLAFLSAGTLLYTLRLSKHDHSPLLVTDLDGASRRYPITALAFSIAVLSLGGLPPLGGFMSKWQIFVAGFESQNTLAMGMVVFTALNSVLSLGYYAPMVNRMYRHEIGDAVKEGGKSNVRLVLPLVLLSIAIIVLGFWPSLVNWIVSPAAEILMRSFGIG